MIRLEDLANEISSAIHHGECFYERSMFNSLMKDIKRLKERCTQEFEENSSAASSEFKATQEIMYEDGDGVKRKAYIIAIVTINDAINQGIVGEVRYLIQYSDGVGMPFMVEGTSIRAIL